MSNSTTETKLTRSSNNLVQNIKFDKPNGTAVITVRTHSGRNIQYRVRTEASIKKNR